MSKRNAHWISKGRGVRENVQKAVPWSLLNYLMQTLVSHELAKQYPSIFKRVGQGKMIENTSKYMDIGETLKT